MPVSKSAKVLEVAQATDKMAAIKKAVGELGHFTVADDLILVGTWVRPEKTSGGVYLAQETLQEDEWQGKVGLVLKKGPNASPFPEIGEWAVYSVKDGWALNINGFPCRLVPSDLIRATTAKPELIY